MAQRPPPDVRTLRVLTRFTSGYTPQLHDDVVRAGGIDKWFTAQLKPDQVPDPYRKRLRTWFPDLTATTPRGRWNSQITEKKSGWAFMMDLVNHGLLLRVHSTRQVQETMADFWLSHLYIPVHDDTAWPWRIEYEATVRRLSLGKFEDLLIAATLHPAMRLYLGNYSSTASAPNENHGRELLELHTVGRKAKYSERAVKHSAQILSGYTVDAWRTWKPRYAPERHATGRVQVLKFSRPNRRRDGRKVTRAYLRYLAHHPKTARTIARALVVRFVSENPDPQLVTHVARAYRRSGTDIRTTLRALVTHPKFHTTSTPKVRNPYENLVATMRALDMRVSAPTSQARAANNLAWAAGSLGMYPGSWPRPDGPPDSNAAWSSPSTMLAAFNLHYSLAGNWYSPHGTALREGADWLPHPDATLRFDSWVQHLARTMTGKAASQKVVDAACAAVDLSPGAIVSAQHAVVSQTWLRARALAVVLDSPLHMYR